MSTIYGRPFKITNVRKHPQYPEGNIVEGFFTDDKDDQTKNPGAFILVAYPETVLHDTCNKCGDSFPVLELMLISCEGVFCDSCYYAVSFGHLHDFI